MATPTAVSTTTVTTVATVPPPPLPPQPTINVVWNQDLFRKANDSVTPIKTDYETSFNGSLGLHGRVQNVWKTNSKRVRNELEMNSKAKNIGWVTMSGAGENTSSAYESSEDTGVGELSESELITAQDGIGRLMCSTRVCHNNILEFANENQNKNRSFFDVEIPLGDTRLLEEHDLTNVLNQLPVDAFNDLFQGKCGFISNQINTHTHETKPSNSSLYFRSVPLLYCQLLCIYQTNISKLLFFLPIYSTWLSSSLLYSKVQQHDHYEPTQKEQDELARALEEVDEQVKSLEQMTSSSNFLDNFLDVNDEILVDGSDICDELTTSTVKNDIRGLVHT